MTFTNRPFVVATLLGAIGLGAIAQTATPPAPAAATRGQAGHHDPARMAEHRAGMAARTAQRQAELKQKLQLSPAQEPAWNSFTAALQSTGHPRPDRESLARMTTPDRIDQMRSLRNERMAQMDRRGDATKALYATLNAEQKKVFDVETAKMAHGPRGRHHD